MSHTSFTRYDPATGRIHSKVNCHHSFYLINVGLYPDLAVVDQDSDLDLDYVDLTGDEIMVRRRPVLAGFDKLLIAADDTAAATLHLPEPFTAEIDGTEYRIDEPNAAGVYELAITSAMPATYKVAIRHFPYLDFETEITAS